MSFACALKPRNRVEAAVALAILGAVPEPWNLETRREMAYPDTEAAVDEIGVEQQLAKDPK